ncbi:Succinate dehydrogenase assembly factor 4, mitochondrial, partial [Frankliniella fusca]
QLRNFASQADSPPSDNSSDDACKAANLAKKLRAKTPIGKLDELEEGRHPFQEKEPLRPWPDNTNPHTGEVGGPKGPEPTRYGDWERKGRVTDF